MAVRLVVVSHSLKLAEGVVEVAAQMAPGVIFHAAGGTDEGGIGTSFTKVHDAVEEAIESGDDVALLTDLGSATMTAESVLDFVSGANHVALAEGPLVEGAVAGAVCAHGGGNLKAVIAAVEDAATRLTPVDPREKNDAPLPARADHAVSESSDGKDALGSKAGSGGEAVAADLVLKNKVGLHARPAASLSRLAAQFDAQVEINGKPAGSVLSLMSLGLPQGATMHVSAVGAQAGEALQAITDLVNDDFGEEQSD